MTQHADQFESCFDDHLILFGETVTYTPKDGSAVTRTAIVDRRPLAMAQDGEIVQPKLTVAFHNDATKGVASADVNIHGDKVTLPLRKGGSAVAMNISLLDEQDGGVTLVGIK